VALLYYIIPNKHYRNGLLTLASLLFYAWGEPKFIIVMLLMVGVNYGCALLISKSQRKVARILFLLIGVIFSVSFLFYFKYFAFIVETVVGLLTGLFGLQIAKPALNITMPIGISFFTFQVLTYIVDVYRDKVKVQTNFFLLLLYVSFFPQLIAGPIVNYKDVENSLHERKITVDDIYSGMLRFIVGLGKKCLLANPCGEVCENLLGLSNSVGGAWIMALCYSLQLYFDFSGYSDMAIGLGRMFGFKFKENFLHPYTAESATDFWRKWHVSLGSFFREYVYIPLGGNRCSTGKWVRNILIVWGLTGIWHGASWNFMVWGLYYGILLLIEKFWLLKIKEKLPKIINIPITLFIVLIGWILFYHTSLSDGLAHIGRLFGVGASGGLDPYVIYQTKQNLCFILAAVLACAPWSEWLKKAMEKVRVKKIISALSPLLALLLLFVSVMMLMGQSYNPFIYFRF